MGALVDRCPGCGVFLKKGTLRCPHCGRERERERRPSPPAPTPEPRRLWAFLHGLALGVSAVFLLMVVGAPARHPTVPPSGVEAVSGWREAAAAVDETGAPSGTEPEMEMEAPAAGADGNARPVGLDPREEGPGAGPDAEAIATVRELLTRAEAELWGWRGRYRVAYSDLHKVLELFARMKEVLGDAAGDGQAGAGEPGEGRDLTGRPQGR